MSVKNIDKSEDNIIEDKNKISEENVELNDNEDNIKKQGESFKFLYW